MANSSAGDDNQPILRRAKFDDYLDVLDIDENLYDGYDYMPSMFHLFLQSRNHLVIVLEVNGKVVGLANFRFYDDDHHLLSSMSGRVSKSFRGHGLKAATSDQWGVQLANNNRNVTRELFVAQIRHYLKPGTYESLYEWNSLLYSYSVPSLRRSLSRWLDTEKKHDRGVENLPYQLTYINSVELLENTNHLEQFLQRYCKGYIPAQWNWSPTKISKEGLKELFATSSQTFITADMTEDGLERSKDVSRMKDCPVWTRVKTIKSLSYSYIFPARAGTICYVMFFGDDAATVPQHVYCHLSHLSATWNGVGGVAVNIPRSLNDADVARHLVDMLGDSLSNSEHMRAPFVLGIRDFVMLSKL